MNSDEESSNGSIGFGYNFVGGDQINQTGSGNIGKIDNRSGRSESFLNVQPQAAAIKELSDFIASMKEIGLVAPDASVRDEIALRSAVNAHQGRLRRVAAAIVSGSKDALIKIIPGIATPLILGAIEALPR